VLDEIEKYHKILNSKVILPNEFLARNSVFYPLVCYVNTIIGLYISENFDIIPIFIKRAYEFIRKVDNETTLQQKYKQTILDYLTLMADFINSREAIENKDILPKDLLNRKPHNHE
jgi:hypothetical protein